MKNVGNSSRGRSQGVPKIQDPHVYGASRGHLCDSTAFLLLLLLPYYYYFGPLSQNCTLEDITKREQNRPEMVTVLTTRCDPRSTNHQPPMSKPDL